VSKTDRLGLVVLWVMWLGALFGGINHAIEMHPWRALINGVMFGAVSTGLIFVRYGGDE
jgi:hypothetical protein